MKFYIIVAVLVVAFASAISYVYDLLAVRRAVRREHGKLLAQMVSLPPVKSDFSTPEGAVLCLEDCHRQRNIEAAVACRDFATEARLWLQERGHLSEEKKNEMLPATVGAMEKSFRDGMAKGSTMDWERTKSFFQPREPFSNGIVIVNEIMQTPDGSLLPQRVLVAETGKGWKVVKLLPNLLGDVD